MSDRRMTALGVALLASGVAAAAHAGRVEHDAPAGWNTVASVLVGSGCVVLAAGRCKR